MSSLNFKWEGGWRKKRSGTDLDLRAALKIWGGRLRVNPNETHDCVERD